MLTLLWWWILEVDDARIGVVRPMLLLLLLLGTMQWLSWRSNHWLVGEQKEEPQAETGSRIGGVVVRLHSSLLLVSSQNEKRLVLLLLQHHCY